jgi:hypothetical protein
MNIDLNERDMDRLKAVARHRGMQADYCAVGLIQRSLAEWETEIRRQNSAVTEMKAK